MNRIWTGFGHSQIGLIFHFKTVGQQLDSNWPRLDSNPSRFEAIKGRFPSKLTNHHSSTFPARSLFSFILQHFEETCGLLGHSSLWFGSSSSRPSVFIDFKSGLDPLEHLFPSRAQATFSGPSIVSGSSRSSRVRPAALLFKSDAERLANFRRGISPTCRLSGPSFRD